MVVCVAILILGSQKAQACTQIEETLSSPDGNIQLRFRLCDGSPQYAVSVRSREQLTWSSLGYSFRNHPSLRSGFEVSEVKKRSHRRIWEQVWGEERHITDHYNEMKVFLVESAGARRQLNLIFRVFDDGMAFRYEIPAQVGLSQFVIMDEHTEFNFVADHPAWWIETYHYHRYEQLYKRSRLSAIADAHTPLTIEGGNHFFSVHEANLTDYASMTLKANGPGRLKADLVPWKNGDKVRATAPMVSPWRTLQIGRTPGDLITSYLILNLNEPNQLADTSWIKPQKYIGIWWGMHLGLWTWSSGPRHGATTERAKQYVDFAAALGMDSVLIEGWNVGWDGDWMENGNQFRFYEPYPHFDLAAVVTYGRSKGVEIMGHHETAGGISNYESQVDDAFRFYGSLGIRAVKTGYVGSRVENGEWHHGQFMVRHYRLIKEKAARNGVMLNIHEPIKDTGIRRTLPNVMTREGARGSEWDAWGGGNPPDHTTIIPFTRGLSGPFDYTPGLFDLFVSQNPQSRPLTTLAKQLALYVVIFSPHHMAADLPENYLGHPAFQFIRDVPTDWHTTRVLHGRIGEYVTIVRRDRRSEDWYLGSITDENARAIEVSLNFLEKGKDYCAEIYQDRPEAHYRHKPMAYEIHRRQVKHGDLLLIRLAPGGGQAIRFRAQARC
jgi:alpha-glucosidase